MPFLLRGKPRPSRPVPNEEPSVDAMDFIDPSAVLPDLEDGSSLELDSAGSGKKSRAARKSKPSKEKLIPSIAILVRVRRIHDGCIEDYSGMRYAVWEVRGCDVLDPQSTNGWGAMLNNLEYPVQVLIRQHAPDYGEVKQSLIQSRPDHMREGWINEVCNSLLNYLSELEDDAKVVTRRWYVVGREDKATEMSSVLGQSGFEATRLGDEQLGMLFQACVSGMGVGHSQDFYQIQEDTSDIQLNHRYASMYEVSKWPRRVSPIFLEQLLRFGEELDASFWIHPLSPRESNTRLQMQRSRFEGSRLVSEQKGKLVPPEVELAISDIVRIADGVERGISRLYRRTMTFAVYGRTREALRDVQDKLEGHFRASLSSVRKLKYRQGQGFACMMPTLKRGLGEPDLTDTDTLLRLFPFGPRDLDRRDGSLLGIDLRSRTSVFVNGFAPEAMNAHMVIMARSGAGKSFFTKLRVLREASRGIRVYLIDPEGEYGVITRALGGRVLVPGSRGHGLNPFVFHFGSDADVEGDLTKRVASLASLVGVMLEGNITQEMKAIIDHCLTGFYAKEYRERGATGVLGAGGMRDFQAFLLSDDVRDAGGQELAQLLSPFATGSARFLMEEDDKDLLVNEAPVTSFNLKNLSSRLKPVATSVCAEVVWGLAVTNPRPRMLIVDEGWTVLSTPSGAEALLTIVKRARKYRLGLTTITQDVQDFLSENPAMGVIAGHAGRALLQNSALKLAFQQDVAALPLVVEALGLNPDMAEFLESSLRGQGVLVGERGDCYPLQVVATPEEMELIENREWLSDGDAAPEMIPEALDSYVPDPEEFRAREISSLLMQRLSADRQMEKESETAIVL